MLDQLPGVGGRHRRRRDRLRVRVDAGRPRHAGHDPRGAAEDPARLRRRRRQRRRALVQEARHRRSAPACTVDRPRARAATAAPPCSFGEGESVDGRPGRRVGRPPPATPTRSASTAPAVEVDDRGFVEVDERCRTGEPGVYAVGDVVATPQLAHVGFAEAIVVDQGHPRRGPACRSTTTRCRGHLLPPRGRVRRATPRRRPRRPGYDVVVVEAPLQRQRPGADHRRDRGHGEGHRREGADGKRRPHPRRAHGRARGSPSSSARATSRSTGRPPSTRSPHFIQPHPTLSRAVRRVACWR